MSDASQNPNINIHLILDRCLYHPHFKGKDIVAEGLSYLSNITSKLDKTRIDSQGGLQLNL